MGLVAGGRATARASCEQSQRGLGWTQHRRQSPRAMGMRPTVRGTESEQDLGVASQMAGPSQKVECVWRAARGLCFGRVQSPGLRVGPWVGPGSEWSQVTGWGLEWEGHIKEEAQGQSPGWGFDSGWGRFELRAGPYWESERVRISTACIFSHSDPCFPPGADRQGTAVRPGPGAADRAPGTRGQS